MDDETPHVLVFPFPGQGHINPMVQFSKRLASKGLKVTILFITTGTTTTTTTIPMTASNTLLQHQYSGSIDIEDISGGFSFEGMESGSVSWEAFFKQLEAHVSTSLSKLIHTKKKSTNKLVLVYDSIMPWALDIAQGLGLRVAAFFTQTCTVSMIYYHVCAGNLRIPLDGGGTSVSLPCLPSLDKDNDLPSFLLDLDSYPALLKLRLDQFLNFRKADWLFFNTFDQLEMDIVKWMASNEWPIKTIGPTIPSMYLDKRLENDKDYGLGLFFKPCSDESTLQWLNSKPQSSVVYVSFGSVASLEEAQMEELAWGLKNSNRCIFWVVRSSEENKLPLNFMNEKSENIMIVNWCNQLEVLSHCSTGCFVTHCGWNSTVEALSLGVPMITMPQWADQITNAKCVEDIWFAGQRLKADEKKGIVGREQIEKGLRQVMEGERGSEIRRSVGRWRDLAAKSLDEGGSSYHNIEEFLQELAAKLN